MTIQVDTVTGAAHWASALINGDESGLEDSERALLDAWQAKIEPWCVVSLVDDSERFTWSYDLHTGDTCRGGSVCDYIVHRTN